MHFDLPGLIMGDQKSAIQNDTHGQSEQKKPSQMLQ
jgi:hypothetical protein